ncbi:hypothetical protein BDEG_27822 [Batrachochytrium dendrobatidis JEL423]|uniref:Uncharacterized protein n=1 Tax=Batrachochytrium dendrobatidis (strain JEL423) TaxID=403673 RepID=A0A177WXB7_BATDL|nr:hypothetical protein BDEG_27822 [Batrachochytrium dendrobatidis JEL423]
MTTKCMSEGVVLACLMSNILTNTDTSCMKLLQYMDIALLRRHWGSISMCIMTTKCMSEGVVLACLISYILTNTDTSCMKLLQYMDIALLTFCRLDIIVDVWRVNNSVHSGRTMSGTTAINSGRQTTSCIVYMIMSSLVQYSMCIMTTKCMSEGVVLACLMSNILTNTDTSCMKLLQYMDIALLRRHWGNISMCIMTTKCMSESVVLTCLISYILTNTDTSCMKLLQYMDIALSFILEYMVSGSTNTTVTHTTA